MEPPGPQPTILDSPFSNTSSSLPTLIFSTLLSPILAGILWQIHTPDPPTINAYRWDFRRKRAREEYMSIARALVSSGFAKLGRNLPSQYTALIRLLLVWRSISNHDFQLLENHPAIVSYRLGQELQRS
jgi:hypothetical protein